jgi:hypothetical protein
LRELSESCVTFARVKSWAVIGLPLALVITIGRPAPAQVTFGSPGDPPRLALGGGVFDILPDHKKAGNGATGMVLSEVRFGDALWIFSPFIGAMGTGKGAVFAYLGFGFDINFPHHIVLTPSFAGGYFDSGHGIYLGSWWEFRSGAELDYRFSDNKRLGVGFYHISNAGLTKENPGAEFLTVVLTAPF